MLRIVDVEGMCVYGEPDPKSLGKLVPRTVELNLSHNLMTSWSSVADIVQRLDDLRILYLR